AERKSEGDKVDVSSVKHAWTSVFKKKESKEAQPDVKEHDDDKVKEKVESVKEMDGFNDHNMDYEDQVDSNMDVDLKPVPKPVKVKFPFKKADQPTTLSTSSTVNSSASKASLGPIGQILAGVELPKSASDGVAKSKDAAVKEESKKRKQMTLDGSHKDGEVSKVIEKKVKKEDAGFVKPSSAGVGSSTSGSNSSSGNSSPLAGEKVKETFAKAPITSFFTITTEKKSKILDVLHDHSNDVFPTETEEAPNNKENATEENVDEFPVRSWKEKGKDPIKPKENKLASFKFGGQK
ncbi:hypothetical protein HDU76_010802, partial [Blyttiomyces sp. JEL0837]